MKKYNITEYENEGSFIDKLEYYIRLFLLDTYKNDLQGDFIIEEGVIQCMNCNNTECHCVDAAYNEINYYNDEDIKKIILKLYKLWDINLGKVIKYTNKNNIKFPISENRLKDVSDFITYSNYFLNGGFEYALYDYFVQLYISQNIDFLGEKYTIDNNLQIKCKKVKCSCKNKNYKKIYHCEDYIFDEEIDYKLEKLDTIIINLKNRYIFDLNINSKMIEQVIKTL